MQSTKQDSVKHQIMQKIASLSGGDNQLCDLLSYCVGRLCLKSSKHSADWLSELNSIDVPHVVDWLKAAIINDDAWLKNVDDKNRPKKLMKFGSFEDVQKEADKAMLRANQQNNDIKLIEGDEELYMQLEDGYHLVKLLTPAALDREGSQMQHCIGGGAYDEFLIEGECYFLSLRDQQGKPHATIQLHGSYIIQYQGKQNEPPKPEYTSAIMPFVLQKKLKINAPVIQFGFVIDKNGNKHKLNELPDNLEVSGNLNLQYVKLDSLPKGMVVCGNLDISLSRIKKLPEGITVKGNLELGGSIVRYLPKKLTVTGDISAKFSQIRKVHHDLNVGGSLILSSSKVQCLPDNLKIGRHLHLSNIWIESLPRGLSVGGDLILGSNPCELTSLPEDLEVGGYVDTYDAQLKIKKKPEKVKRILINNGSNNLVL
jgi:hypothetical protein